MREKTIVIRTMGSGGIGFGHFFRCLSLAKAIRQLSSDADIVFIVNDELSQLLAEDNLTYYISNNFEEDLSLVEKLKPVLFIFDSYLGNINYLREVKQRTKLMLIDDNNDIYDSTIADILYNGNIHADILDYPLVEGQIRLIGTKYLLMKEEYWSNTNQDQGNQENGILITTGGSDEHHIAIRLLQTTLNLNGNVNTKVIIGPGYAEDYVRQMEQLRSENIELIYKPKSLKSYISNSKVVITASGSTIYEVLSQGRTPIIFSLADNQDIISEQLMKAGIVYLGKYPNINYELLRESIKNIYENKTSVSINMDKSASKICNLVDGRGALRVAESILDTIFV